MHSPSWANTNFAGGRDGTDPLIFEVGDIETAGGIDGSLRRAEKLCVRGGTSVAAEARCAGAGDGGDDPVGRDAADAVVHGVGDVEVAGGIESHTARSVQLRRRGGSAIPAEAVNAGARDGGGRSVGGDLPDRASPEDRRVEVVA